MSCLQLQIRIFDYCKAGHFCSFGAYCEHKPSVASLQRQQTGKEMDLSCPLLLADGFSASQSRWKVKALFIAYTLSISLHYQFT